MPMSLQTASLEELKRRERLNSSLWEQRVRLERGEAQSSRASDFPQVPQSKHIETLTRNEEVNPKSAGSSAYFQCQEWPNMGCLQSPYFYGDCDSYAIFQSQSGLLWETCRNLSNLVGWTPPWGDASELRGRLARQVPFHLEATFAEPLPIFASEIHINSQSFKFSMGFL